MPYREVYMLDIPKQNNPISYTNAALVTTCLPGHAAYAYADNKHKPTHRTLFRLYLLDKVQLLQQLLLCNGWSGVTDNPEPIGSPLVLLLMAVLYLFYKKSKKNTRNICVCHKKAVILQAFS